MGLLTLDVAPRAEIDDHGIDVRPVAGALGAELRGVDLRALDAAGVVAVKDLLHHYEVIFFPGADLTDDEQLALARQFGELNIFPVARLRGVTEPSCTVITDGPDSPPEADDWHTDVTWIAEPPNYALLSAQIVPQTGWRHLVGVDDGCLRSIVAGHAPDDRRPRGGPRQQRVHSRHAQEDAGRTRRRSRWRTPCVKRSHPSRIRWCAPIPTPAGRRSSSPADSCGTSRGCAKPESDNLLGFLRQHIENAALQCRWRWSPGDLAIWDERSTNHRSAADHFPQERSIRRVEVSGDRPYHRAVAG